MKLLQIMRPRHWIKNIFLFAALVFGQKLAVPSALGRAIGGFFCFSLAASAVYIFNDIIDRKTDSAHPEKCKRPIAAGAISVSTATVMSIGCAVPAIIGSFVLARYFGIVILTYIVLMILYSLGLKRMMILDCVVISIGFCLRAIAGAVVVGVFISPWLIICTFALCLFLAFSKRRSEIAMLGEDSESFRQTLAGYSPELLAHMVDVTSGLAIVCFLLYAMDERTVARFGTVNLVYTTPLVLYCVFRLSALIQKGKFSGPVQLILADLPFQIGFVLWVLSCIAIIYADKLGISFGGT
ncbi:MAG: decaprenyl-phosphate phosphoribosyltransferase [Planctomycetes bacterium B3_Pla]|nr:MAG: decaprenyl-phosphate phosphoribosyltransferase [Planctomycetes bacterium B3_Pla]